MANTTNLLLSAKSTRARIISCFLSIVGCPPTVTEPSTWSSTSAFVTTCWPGFSPDLISCRFVLSVQEVSTDHFHAAKLLVGRGNEDKIAIVHVQDGGCRDNRVHLPGLTAEGGPHEHAQPHDSRILNFDPNLGRADVGIENRADVAHPSLEHAIGIGIQADLRGIAEPDAGQVVLVHVADNPDVTRGRKS